MTMTVSPLANPTHLDKMNHIHDGITPKATSAIALGVVALHAMTGWSLLQLTPAKLPAMDEPMPIEIAVVTDTPISTTLNSPIQQQTQTPNPTAKPTVKPTAKPEANHPVARPKVAQPVQSKPQAELQPSSKADPQPVAKSEPIVSSKPIVKPVAKPNPVVNTKPVITTDNNQSKTQVQPSTDEPVLDRKNTESQTEPAVKSPQTQTQAPVQSQTNTEHITHNDSKPSAQQQTTQINKSSNKTSTEGTANNKSDKANEGADEKAKGAGATESAESKTVSNEPVNFSESQANWKYKPSFALPKRLEKEIRPGDKLVVKVRLRVNKQGGVDEVVIISPSGNRRIDQMVRQTAKQGKLYPFKQNGVPVVGLLTLTLEYGE